MAEHTHDRFTEDYERGVTEELPAASTSDVRLMAPRAAVPDGLALGGCVLTPEGPVEDGYVVIATDGTIASVEHAKPDAVPVLATGGVILPGLIDLHGHPEFNIFAAWEPPTRFANRFEWRSSDVYRAVVRDPQNRLRDALPPGTQARYAEVRALVGGTTAIQGASAAYPGAREALVRNVDLSIFGEHRARSMVDLPREDKPDNLARLAAILDDIEATKVRAFYIHLAEGCHGDSVSVQEFDRAVDLGALTPATVVIHGTALDRRHFGAMRDVGAKLVWSPQSQLRLYGQATRVGDALDIGLPVGLGADWLPSGSPSLLAELKVARRTMAGEGRPLTARRLVDMVTSDAAQIAGLDDRLGTLTPGRAADIVVLERHHEDPWENVVQADPAWVDLVVIGGDVAYGRHDWAGEVLGPDRAGALETVLAWGKPMRLDVTPAGSSLAELRSSLVTHYPQVGPIFA
jgi:cytosine/adenosine deaminase-related metal-dependent hydrolase